MLKVKFILIMMFLLFLGEVYPQLVISTTTDTPSSMKDENPLGLYPLHVGDKKQYFVESKVGDRDTSYYITSKIVGKDTCNGEVYFLLSDGLVDCYRYIRIDSSNATVWEKTCGEESECMIDSLAMSPGNDWFLNDCYGFVYCIADTTKEVFEKERYVKSFEWKAPLTCIYCPYRDYQYAEGIGLIYSKYVLPAPSDYEYEYSIMKLLYAKINGIEYGEPVNPLKYYPLHLGDRWFYDWSIDGGTRKYVTTSEIIDKVIKPNGLEYYQRFEENKTTFERIDSSTGIVYQYDETADSTNYEILKCSITARKGDTLLTKDGFHQIYSNEYLGKAFDDDIRFYKFYIPEISTYIEEFAYGFGSYKRIHGLNGETTKVLKGCIIDGKVFGDTTLTPFVDISDPLPTEFNLEQNYPNPFNPSTTIKYSIPRSTEYYSVQQTTLKVYDVLGREVTTLVNEEQKPGRYEVKFNAENLGSGVYFYKLKAGNFAESKKMILLK